MKLETPEIAWHGRQPIYSLDFQFLSGRVRRLATAGVDAYVRIWYVDIDDNNRATIQFASNLKRHAKSVNVVRFSPNGKILASADDDSAIYLWKKNEDVSAASIFDEDEEIENKEAWTAFKMLRGHLDDVCDLSWSPDNLYLISGSVDNSAVMWDASRTFKKLKTFTDHNSFVQGVAWDPKNQFIATCSCDRSCRVYSVQNFACLHNLTKTSTAVPLEDGKVQVKSSRLFLDENTKSFVRRPCFTPDGELLIVPAGCFESGDQYVNATHVFTRKSLPKPALHLPSLDKITVAVRCCPVLFELRKPSDCSYVQADATNNNHEPVWKKYNSVFGLPYRVIFAIATETAVLLYDTQQNFPFASVSNIHYTILTDLAWSADGRILACSSSDGYCSLISFEEGELGIPYSDVPKMAENADIMTELPTNIPNNNSGESQKPSSVGKNVTLVSSTGELAHTNAGLLDNWPVVPSRNSEKQSSIETVEDDSTDMNAYYPERQPSVTNGYTKPSKRRITPTPITDGLHNVLNLTSPKIQLTESDLTSPKLQLTESDLTSPKLRHCNVINEIPAHVQSGIAQDICTPRHPGYVKTQRRIHLTTLSGNSTIKRDTESAADATLEPPNKKARSPSGSGSDNSLQSSEVLTEHSECASMKDQSSDPYTLPYSLQTDVHNISEISDVRATSDDVKLNEHKSVDTENVAESDAPVSVESSLSDLSIISPCVKMNCGKPDHGTTSESCETNCIPEADIPVKKQPRRVQFVTIQ